MWPSLVDMSKDDCRKALRTLELETYGSIVSVLRAQGHFSSEKKKLLSDVATALCIPIERHKAEIRKAVNDDTLNFIAEMLVGPNTATEWAIEGRRLFPPFPKPAQCTAFASIADEAADYISGDHENFASTSETVQKAAELPYTLEPSSPEASKTQVQTSDSGLLVLPSGAAIQMKRESEEEEGERKKKKPPVADSSQIASPSSPPSKIMVGNQGQQIPMTSKTMPLPQGSTPLKIALPTGATRTPTSSIQTLSSTTKQVIFVSNSGTPNTPSILQKTLSVPMKSSTVKPSVIYTPNASSNATESFKPRPKPITSTPIAKPRSNAIVVSQKTPIKASVTPAKHGMPMHTKIVVQQKCMPRNVPKPQHLMVQQKPVKQAVVTNVQVKTPQGFANVPVQLRTATSKPQTMQIKQDPGGQMKVLSLSGGTKILPKPSQPVYVVTTSSTPLTMVTRTVPASCPPRVMTVTTGNQGMKWNQSSSSGKSMQTVHVMTQPRRHDSVVLVQKGAAGKGIATQVPKESSVGKGPTKAPQKPITAISTSLGHLQLPVNQTQSGANVILLDLSNSEKVSNPMLADILQASGILSEDDGKTVSIDLGSSGDDGDEGEKETKKDLGTKEDASAVSSMSIEQAVEMLNRSDTPETRAILSQAGIQISDEIADSEEEEQTLDSSQISDQILSHKDDSMDIKDDSLEESQEMSTASDISKNNEPLSSSCSTAMSASASIPATAHTIYSRPRLDIFTTALTSANINLDSFMEEEDDPEPSAEDKADSKSGTGKNDVTGATMDSTADPLDVQLAELTGEIGH